MVLFCSQVQSYAGDFAKDTVWTNNTDENSFSSFQFIKNDEIIVAQSGYTIFYDAIDGKEIYRLLGGNAPVFFNEDKNFLRLNNGRKIVEIFDTETYQIIGELESDDLSVGSLKISKDENLLIGGVTNGLRVWDMNTKKILRTKTQELSTSLTGMSIFGIDFINNTTIVAGVRKDYKINVGSVFTNEKILFDLESLDSIGNYGDKGYIFSVSQNKKYIAYGKNGVEIYNLETGKLISTIPINSLSLTGMEFSNDEKFIVTASTVSDNLLAIWSVETGKQLYEYTRASTSAFAISKNDKFIIKESGRLLIKYKITDQMLSVEEQNQNTIIYPNPTNGNLEIKYNINRPDVFQYEITNINGQVLLLNHLGFKTIGQNTDVIQVETLARGNYNLRLFSTQDNINFKFIKE